MADIKSYKDLLVWQKAMALSKAVYQSLGQFPKYETYGLCDQLRRSSVSIPSNIAEGQARQPTNEFRQFLYIALGSLAELDTQLILAKALNYITNIVHLSLDQQISEIRRMLHSLISRLPT